MSESPKQTNDRPSIPRLPETLAERQLEVSRVYQQMIARKEKPTVDDGGLELKRENVIANLLGLIQTLGQNLFERLNLNKEDTLDYLQATAVDLIRVYDLMAKHSYKQPSYSLIKDLIASSKRQGAWQATNNGRLTLCFLAQLEEIGISHGLSDDQRFLKDDEYLDRRDEVFESSGLGFDLHQIMLRAIEHEQKMRERGEFPLFVGYEQLPDMATLRREFPGHVSEIFNGREFIKHELRKDIPDIPGIKTCLLARPDANLHNETELNQFLLNMDAKDYIPATEKELFAFKQAYPKEQMKDEIVGAGAIVSMSSRDRLLIIRDIQHIARLYGEVPLGAFFDDTWFDGQWDRSSRFLFVRK